MASPGGPIQTAIVELVPSRAEHRPALETFLRDWNALRVARRGVLVDSLDHPAVLAWSEGDLMGVAPAERAAAHAK